jgi:predicted Zn-dependent protease
MKYIHFLLLVLLFLTACYTVPETGRKSLLLLPEKTVSGMSLQAFDQLRQEGKVSENTQYRAQVDRVVRRILSCTNDSANLPPIESWEWTVFEDDNMINAFAMPGGKIGVYTGMLKLVKTDDELAVVLGHEIAHVAARHGNERVSRGLLISGIGLGLEQANISKDPKVKEAVLTAFGVGANIGVVLPYSRNNESEADEIGLLYAAQAGYDPRVAITFWQKMGNAYKGKTPPEFLSTHPSSNTRIERLEILMPRAVEVYNQAKKP